MSLIKRGTQIRDLPESFLRLLNRLRAFRVDGWEHDSDGPTWPKIDREAAGLIDADVVSSQINDPTPLHPSRRKHVLAIDIDWPCYLVESSTEGHHHLYVDVPGGIPHEVYMRLMAALGEAKVVQPGYANMAKIREHSDLRLPWVSKAKPYIDQPTAVTLPVPQAPVAIPPASRVVELGPYGAMFD